ncbi:MAG: hypothetical protein M3N53_07335 [Actinomycetota bacterium]|nr:hypothetical protein [Actinomycetota bacterium]
MKIEDRRGEAVPETTVTVDDEELIDLLQGLADLIEGKREHLHFQQLGGPELVVQRAGAEDAAPIERQMDWWVGPLVLFAVVFVIIGAVTVVRWAVGLVS